MKKYLFFLLLIMPLFGMTQVADDFTDGNFTTNPTWIGDTNRFEVNSSKQLHLRSSGSDPAIILVQNSRMANTEWDFWIKLSFNTSANNHARIYIAADNQNLEGSINGYYLQAGGSSDSLEFYRQEGVVHQKLFRGTRSFTGNSTNILRIKMIHDSAGTWHLFSDDTGNTNFVEEGSCKETSITQTSWFGFYCRHTTSNSTKFYFDDIYIGPVIIDSVAPTIKTTEVVSDHELDVTFSESINKTSGEDTTNYFIQGYGFSMEALQDTHDLRVIHLRFRDLFREATCDTLIVQNIMDLRGNTVKKLRGSFCIYEEKAYDIVINEIMADPDPQVGLPDAEYVELYNRSSFPIRMKDWVFEAGSTRKTLPDVTITPSGFLILTKGGWLGFYGASADLFTSSSTLTNNGSTLVLKNKKEKVIHSVTYTPDWYNNSLKELGGWSLEMIDPENPCGCAGNWSSSISPLGGTPGTLNSIFHSNLDTNEPYLKRAVIENTRSTRIIFSEPMDSVTLSGPGKWKTNNNAIQIDSVSLLPPEYSEIILDFNTSIQTGVLYELWPPAGIRDCSGKVTDTAKSVQFAIADTLSAFDIVINEILPDPYTGGERFIELFNRSLKVLDLKTLVLADADSNLKIAGDPVMIAEEGYLIFPGEYIVLTKDPMDIQARYRTPGADCLIKMSSFPTMDDDDGTVILAKGNDLTLIDRVDYKKKMQFPLLISTNGVSLERINADIPSASADNWHSASETCGFATPGYKNSQAMVPGSEANIVVLNPEIFSPDNDGKEDLLFIQFHLDQPDYIVNIGFFDTHGRMIRQLVRNAFVSSEGMFSWDGTTDESRKAPTGIYIAWIELFSPDGTVKHFKKPIVVAGNL